MSCIIIFCRKHVLFTYQLYLLSWHVVLIPLLLDCDWRLVEFSSVSAWLHFLLSFPSLIKNCIVMPAVVGSALRFASVTLLNFTLKRDGWSLVYTRTGTRTRLKVTKKKQVLFYYHDALLSVMLSVQKDE